MKQNGSRHRLLAILVADVAGYSRLMADDDLATVAALDAARGVFRLYIESHEGRVIDMAGDSVLAAFEAASGAVNAAIVVQRRLAALAHELAAHRRMHFRIGIHLGDVIEKDNGSVYGDGVNIAARLESLAEPGGVAVSYAVREAVANRIDAAFDDIGEQSVKNIAQPAHVFRVRMAGAATSDGLRFDGFEIQPRERRLLVDGAPASLGSRAWDVLLALIERRDRLVTKNELLDAAWPGLVVGEDDLLVQQVSALRKVLGPEVIATVPGRGYRFTAQPDSAHGVAPIATAPAPALAAAARLKTNLPAALPPLIGRDNDFAALAALVDQHRLVTIAGAGGMGKTRLAQALLFERRDAYEHGVCFVELAATAEAGAVPGVIGSALGVAIGSSGEALQALVSAAAPLSMLIVLDNAEHLIGAVAAAAQAMYGGAPNVRLLVTSQAALKLAEERLYRLGPLDLPEGAPSASAAMTYGALALFVERAQAADRRFALTDDNVATVIDICRRLDGVALAIELAAARVPLLGLPKLAASLDQRLRVRTAGGRTAPPRQQTLRAALEWSHALLDEAEQKVFRRLAVFVGSASLESAQRVVADVEPASGFDEWAVLDALGALVDRSLVAVVGESSSNEALRYQLLDTPHAFALERLQTAGEEAALRQRHALAMRALFEPALEARFSGRVTVDAWARAMAPDCDNAHAAISWAVAGDDPASALAIAPALHYALTDSSMRRQCSALWEVVEPLLDLPDARARRPVLTARTAIACSAFWASNRPKRAVARARQAAETLHGTADRAGLYLALAGAAWAASRSGDAAAAAAALQGMRAVEEPGSPPVLRIHGAEAECAVVRACGDFEQALRWARHQAELEQAAGFADPIAATNAIDIALAAGRAAEAARDGRALMARLTGSRNQYGLAFARINLAAALLADGAVVEARRVAQDGWPQATLFEMQACWADHLALLAALEGRPCSAARLVGYADAVYTATENSREGNEAASVQRALRIASEAHGDDTVARLETEGAALRDEDIAALAFGSENRS